METRNGTDKSSDGKREVPRDARGRQLFHANIAVQVVVNWREFHQGRHEGPDVEASVRTVRPGDVVAFDEEYVERYNVLRLLDPSNGHGGLPAIEPLDLHEQRLEAERKLNEARAEANTDVAQVAAEAAKVRVASVA